jgi:hypothetical protein
MKTKTNTSKAYVPPPGATAPFTNYCRKDKFREQDGKYWGNWSPSFGGACTSPSLNSYIEKAAVIEKTELGKCSDSGINVIKVVSN